MKELESLPTRQTGKLGELFVQYQLLKYGIESAHLTTDAGIDLVAYSPHRKEAYTIQVKATLKPAPGGGRGHDGIGWRVRDNSPADFFAFVHVQDNQAWIFSKEELNWKGLKKGIAQQRSKSGMLHFYMYVVPKSNLHAKIGIASHVSNFDKYRLEKERIKELF